MVPAGLMKGVEIVEQLAHWIEGRALASKATESETLYNPATEEVVGEVGLNDVAALDRAVVSAERVQPAWAATPVMERARVFFRYRELLTAHRAELARLVTEENGKTLADADGEVGRGIEVVELASAAPSLLKGQMLPDVSRQVDTTMLRVPLGVAAGITPYNFPAMIPLWMFPLALVAGNAFILKPSERTPRTALRLAELLQQAGLPEGLLAVVHGGRPVVEAITRHAGIRAVSFVGSQPVALSVYQQASHHGKRVQALGGAKNYHVVMPDAILDKTVDALIGSAYGAAGQRCLAASVVIAVGEVGDRLVDALEARGEAIRLGPGWEPETDMGPLIRQGHRERVKNYIHLGIQEGARMIRDGRKDRMPAEGYFLGPTLFDQVESSMTIAQEEIFGPVLSVMRRPDLGAAVETANQSRFGNTASIYTQDGGHARYFRDHIGAGMVGVNIGVAAPVALFPFAGFKDSFYGDLHATGDEGLMFYTERRVLTSRYW